MTHSVCDCYSLNAGDWHVAYILLYGPQRLEKLPEEPSPPEKMVTDSPVADTPSTKDP